MISRIDSDRFLSDQPPPVAPPPAPLRAPPLNPAFAASPHSSPPQTLPAPSTPWKIPTPEASSSQGEFGGFLDLGCCQLELVPPPPSFLAPPTGTNPAAKRRPRVRRARTTLARPPQRRRRVTEEEVRCFGTCGRFRDSRRGVGVAADAAVIAAAVTFRAVSLRTGTLRDPATAPAAGAGSAAWRKYPCSWNGRGPLRLRGPPPEKELSIAS